MNKQKRIEELEKELKELKGQRFAEVQFSNKEYILLEDERGFGLVKTWMHKAGLNDFNSFERQNDGHFWIGGKDKPFEILLNGKWVYCDDYAPVRFLNE